MLTGLGALVTALAVLVLLPPVQTQLAKWGTVYLENKIGTPVAIEELQVSVLGKIHIAGLYLEDQQGDTLLYCTEFSAAISPTALLKNTLHIRELSVNSLTAGVYSLSDSLTPNYGYLLEAFADEPLPDKNLIENEGEKEQTAGFELRLDRLQMENIRVGYQDNPSQLNAQLQLDALLLLFRDFSLKHNRYLVDTLGLVGLQAVYQDRKPSPAAPEPTQETAVLPNVNIDRLWLEKIQADVALESQAMALLLDTLHLAAPHLDLPGQVVAVNHLLIGPGFFSYTDLSTKCNSGPSPQKDIETQNSQKAAPWQLSLNRLVVQHFAVSYQKAACPRADVRKVDPHHLLISELQIDTENLLFNDTLQTLHLNHLSFKEQSGFAIESLSATFFVGPQAAGLPTFRLKMPCSLLEANGQLTYRNMQSLDQGRLVMAIDTCRVCFEELSYFSNFLPADAPFQLPAFGEPFQLKAAARGRLSDFEVTNLDMQWLKDTHFHGVAQVKNAPDWENLALNVLIEPFRTSKRDLDKFIKPSAWPDGISLPAWYQLEASLAYSPQQIALASRLLTDQGNAVAYIDWLVKDSIPYHDIGLFVGNYHIGQLLKDTLTYGEASFDILSKGKGSTLHDLETHLEGRFYGFDYRDHRFADLEISGQWKESAFIGKIAIDDPYLAFNFEGQLDLSEKPYYGFQLDLGRADLYGLALHEDTVLLSLRLAADISGSSLNDLNGSLGLYDLKAIQPQETISVDSLVLAIVEDPGQLRINVLSEVMYGSLESNLPLEPTLEKLGNTVRRYYDAYRNHLHEETIVTDSAVATLHLEVLDTDLLRLFLPGDVREITPFKIDGLLDTRASKLELNAYIPQVLLPDVSLDSVYFYVKTLPDYAYLATGIGKTTFAEKNIYHTGLVATLEQDTVWLTLSSLDALDSMRFSVGLSSNRADSTYYFRFVPGLFTINYDPWDIPANNYISLQNGQLQAHEARYQFGEQEIAFQTFTHNQYKQGVRAGFSQIDLGYFAPLLGAGVPVIGGLLNGSIDIRVEESEPRLLADLNINDLAVSGDTLGNLSLLFNNNQTGLYKTNVELAGEKNTFSLLGEYQQQEEETFQAAIEIGQLDLNLLNSYSGGQLSEAEGSISGRLFLMSKPVGYDITGRLQFEKAGMRLNLLNTYFFFDNEAIVFDSKGIRFDDFTMVDEQKNKATLNGHILTRDYLNYAFDLQLVSSRLQLLNTTAADNSLYYGRLFLSSNTRIRGTPALPSVSGRIALEEGTDLTYILPEDELSAIDRKGIVEFVQYDQENDTLIALEEPLVPREALQGMDLSINIDVNPQTQFTVEVDPAAGDRLSIRGGGTLSYTLNRAGNMSLTGTYTINRGNYELSFYDLVRRNFQIREGSTMTWTGDILNADANITAIYPTKASPLELVASEIPVEKHPAYRPRRDFLVYLNMKGPLLEPEISFEIDMPEDRREAAIYTRILQLNQNEAERNKQVFALLLLNSFISDGPGSEAEGSLVTSTARSSVSRLLSQQLNRLSDRLVKGVDINFDLQSFDNARGSAEGQTTLDLDISKKMFDDRMSIEVGSNFDLSGNGSSAQDAGNPSGFSGNIAIEYKLTKDGRYRIRTFSRNEFDGLIGGEILNTGAALIFTRDYTKLRELFKIRKKSN